MASGVLCTALEAWAAATTLQQKRELIRNCSDKSDASTAALLESLLEASVKR